MIDHVAILADLVRRPSVNPMGRDVSGPEYLEGRITDHLLQRFTAAGIPCVRQQVSPGRDNVLARLDPPDGSTGPLLLWDAHQDTVPVDGMTIDPFTPLVRDGRLQGRGACDVKGGMASMLVALEQLRREGGSHRPILFAATVNEEFGFSGAKSLAALWMMGDAAPAPPIAPERPSCAIVAEPTSLQVVTTHKGAVRWRVRVRGRACHSAFPENGRNAIYPAARVALAIEGLASDLATRDRPGPCGPPTLSVGTIRGGTGVNLVPDLVVLEVDRRIVPGESPADARREVIDRIAVAVAAAGFAPDTVEHEEPFLESAGLPDEAHALSVAITTAAAGVGVASRAAAARYGTNASIYSAAGIPSVVFGPGSIDQAHTCDEWIDLAQVRQAADVLVAVARA